MKKIFALVLALILAVLPMAAFASQNGEVRYVNTGNSGKLNVRRTPYAPANNLITKLENGTKVTVTDYTDGNTWAIIEFKLNGQTVSGYVQNRYLSQTKPYVPATPETPASSEISFRKFQHVTPYQAFVKPSTPGGFVNMRWAPSKSVDVMARLYANTEVTVIAKDSTWAQIYDPASGYVGYMMLSFLK